MTKTEQIAVQTINIGGSEIPVEQEISYRSVRGILLFGYLKEHCLSC